MLLVLLVEVMLLVMLVLLVLPVVIVVSVVMLDSNIDDTVVVDGGSVVDRTAEARTVL